MKGKIFKKKISNPAALISILILVVLLLAGLWAVQNTIQTRGKAAAPCLYEGQRGCYTRPCCPGLKCMSNRCVKGTTAPTPYATPTPACVMKRLGCGPIKCGGITCSAGSACYQNSCYPTNTVCTVEAACSTAPTPYGGTPTPTPCPMIKQGCGPISCGPFLCSAGFACYSNSCHPTTTVCQRDNSCSEASPIPTTPGCTYSYRNVGCGPRQCGPNYCQRRYMCREKTTRCGSSTTTSYLCEYNSGCR